MVIRRFPDPDKAPPEGILAVGGDLEVDSLRLAYGQGIFPWPIPDLGLAWFCPDPRAILEFSNLHIPRSLKKVQKRRPFSLSIDRAFSEVIAACSGQPRPGQDGTWITPDMIAGFCDFHQAGFAHSVEVWEGRDLVGGLYGVCTAGVFCAESMFHVRPNASKIALLYLVDFLKSKGATWIDIQVMTPHMQRLGATEISRENFLKKLAASQAMGLKLF